MVNCTHLKVLLRKDFITLWRSWGFCISFILIPIILMQGFIAIRNLIVTGYLSGPLIFDNFKYTTTNYTNYPQMGPNPSSFYDYKPLDNKTYQVFASSLSQCNSFQSQNKVGYSKIAIVATDPQVQTAAKSYFQSYVIPKRLIVGGFQRGRQSQGEPYTVEVFQNVNDVFNIIQTVDDQPYCFIVNFNSFNTATDQYDVQFSFQLGQLPNTNLPSYNPLLRTPDLSSYQGWFSQGTAELFPLITEFIARYKIGGSVITQPEPLFIQQMGFTPMQSLTFINASSQGISQLAQNFPFFFMIIFIIPFFFLTSKLASEKETKAKEGMKMMGLQNSTYYFAWFIYYMVISFVTSIIVTILSRRVFDNVNGLLFFIFCILYSINLWGLAFTIVSFLPTKRSSGIASVLFHFITYYLQSLITDAATPSGTQYGLSILPNVAMGQIIKQVFFYSFQTQNGLDFQSGKVQYQGYSFSGGLIMMFFMGIFWSFLGLYLDQVIPTEFGISKPWYFLCQCKSKKKKQSIDAIDDEENYKDKDMKNFEKIPEFLKKQEKDNECLKIRGLVKQFGQKTAVNGTSMTMYNGQIFALLGHNGAGKTTTISMLNGMLEPTEGKAEVFGINMFENMQDIRMMLGVCPQHDVLFEMLTPEEHLRLFASFKGTDPKIIDEQVDQMIKDIDLIDVKTQQACTLSGGQKRKLSVAIAMIGNSKIVMLDEPTSGMDTTARRKLWEMLKKNKAGKIVILTTHYMDEADILGDRIAIMAEGDVQCTGSSLFLKNRYGVGYNLTIAKLSRQPAPQVDLFIQQRISNAKKLQEVSSEISYQLPNESSLQFKNFFAEFDQNLTQLGVSSYSVGITTLEEVFLKIGHGEDVEKLKQQQRSEKRQKEVDTNKKMINDDDSQEYSQDQELENYSVVDDGEEYVFFSHLWQLIRKKVLMQVRDLKTLSIDILFPLILIIIGLKISTIAVIIPQVPKLLSPQLYPQENIYTNQNSSLIGISQNQTIVNFVNENFIGQFQNLFNYQSQLNLQIDTTQNTTNQILSLDNYIFQISQQQGVQTTGNLFVQSLNDPNQGYSAVILVNSTQQEAVGVYASMGHNAFLKHYCNQPQSGLNCQPNLQINFTNTPFPLDKRRLAVINAAAGTRSAILMTIAWLMVSDSLIQNIIRERSRNIKHQIMISGSSVTAYWLGHYLADMVFQACLSIISIICYYGFSIDLPQGWVLFLVMIASNPPFVYFISFLCHDEETGSLVIKFIYFIIGLICPIAISVLQYINSSTVAIGNAIRWIFYPFPIYSLSFGYISICNRPFIQLVNKLKVLPDSFDNLVAGPALWFLLSMIGFYWLMILLIEVKFFDFLICRGRSQQQIIFDKIDNENADNDIEDEAQRVKSMTPEQLPVRLLNVQKKYGNVVAVKDISFGLEYGECFALLGISGAGKSTLFKCLTGEVYPSNGKLTINGHNVVTRSGFEQARKQIGYCPQFDAIFEGLTVLEHLQIYATLKGIRFDLKERIIQKQIEDMDLQDYIHTKANQLSGGNRRKLSVSMALIGNPPLIFLDEPSTGVDPQAKRFMWDILSKISTQRKKSAVIITTHSMEEAEALCTKMGIMVSGEFKCFGSSTYVKDKYGTGYEIEIKIKNLEENLVQSKLDFAQKQGFLPFTLQSCLMYLQSQEGNDLCKELSDEGEGRDFFETIKLKKTIDPSDFIKWCYTENQGNQAINFIENKFKEFQILEHYGTSWKIKVSRDQYSIGYLFGMMEDIQNDFNISEYSVAQTTLEQIFNNFALQAERNAGKKSINKVFQKKKNFQNVPPNMSMKQIIPDYNIAEEKQFNKRKIN